MKLKSVIIAACSCLCIQAMADGTFFKQFKDNGRIAARLHAVTTQRGMVLSRAGLMAERALPAAAPAGRLRLARQSATLKRARSSSTVLSRLTLTAQSCRNSNMYITARERR